MLRKSYWVCISEKRIYHTQPSFSTPQEKADMKLLGITKQEKWTEINTEKAVKYASGWRPHYVYTAYTVPEFEIIDCPELSDYQNQCRLYGMYIPTLLPQKYCDEDFIEDFVLGM